MERIAHRRHLVRHGQFGIELVEMDGVEIKGDPRLFAVSIAQRHFIDMRVAVTVAADPRSQLEHIRQRPFMRNITAPFGIEGHQRRQDGPLDRADQVVDLVAHRDALRPIEAGIP